MSDIPPALSEAEWHAKATAERVEGPLIHLGEFGLVVAAERLGGHAVVVGRDVSTLAAAIALANAAVNDEDPRKLTRKHVNTLRRVATAIRKAKPGAFDHPELDGVGVTLAYQAHTPNFDDPETLDALADVLESYLPAAE